MLQINTSKYKSIFGWSGLNTNYLGLESCTTFQNHYDYYKSFNLGDIALPLIMNGYILKRHYGYISTTSSEEKLTGLKENIFKVFNKSKDEDINIIHIFVQTEEILKQNEISIIDKDIFTEIKDDAIESLYNKCNEQTSLRETERQDWEIHVHSRIFKSKAKHNLIIVTDFPDSEQESLFFLTFGLLPVLYEDIKEKLEPKELEFFKVLVNRSQVKRISNVKPVTAYMELENLNKYKTKEKEIRFKTLFEQLVENRSAQARNMLSNAKNYIDSSLRDYNYYLNKYNESKLLIEKFDESKEDALKELELLSKTEGIEDIKNVNNGESAQLVIKVPIRFYDIEETEMQLNRRTESFGTKFIKDIFLEQQAQLMILSTVVFNFSGTNFRAMTSLNEETLRYYEGLFNPHFQYYACLGNYKPKMIKAMNDQDLLLFANIAIAATASINFSDGAVIGRWIDDMNNTYENYRNSYIFKIPCLLKDGEMYTIDEYINGFVKEEIEEPEEPEELEINEL